MGFRDWLPDPLSLLKFTAGCIVVGVGSVGGLLYTFQTSLIYPAGMPAGLSFHLLACLGRWLTIVSQAPELRLQRRKSTAFPSSISRSPLPTAFGSRLI
jgi:hypothetical protein